MAEDNIDKALPNEPRKEFNIPGEEEIQEQVVEEVQAEQESLGPVDIQENEDGSVDINLDPNAASPEGGDEHYANLADFLPDDVLGRMASDLSSKVSRICFIKKRLGKDLHTRFRFIRFQIRSKNRTI
jgi:hypothetical protein